MDYIVGIDPGFSGAIALLSLKDTKPTLIRIWDMPVKKVSYTGKKKARTEMDLVGLGEILIPPAGGARTVSCLETVSAMGGQGVTSMFRFGQGYGAVQMALTGHGWEQHDVRPVVWKEHHGLIKAPKNASRELAAIRFPDHADLFKRVRDDGRAEAALIALYCAECLLT